MKDNKKLADLVENNIDMLSKNEVKYIQSLFHKKLRNEDGVFVAEGPKLVQEIIVSGYEVVKGYATKDWFDDNEEHQSVIIEIASYELEKISSLQTPNQIVVIARQKVLNDQPFLNENLTLVLDGLQDPGNMGTIIRIADWFGVKQIVASENSVDLYNSKVVQATMGSILRVNVWYKDLAVWMPSISIPVYGALLNGISIYDIQEVSEGVLVMGNESKGISKELLPMISQPVTIPKIGDAESLNAAVATGIILSHFSK
jgi:TrmH family RNA methyltransferase